MLRRGFRYRHVVLALAALLLVSGCDYFISAESRLERAESRAASGDYRSALIEVKNALKSEPNLPKARLLLAEIALWLGDAQSAEKELGLVPAGTDAGRQADLQARIDLAMNRSQPLLDRLNAGDSQLSAARVALYRGQAMQALNRISEAEEQFRIAAQADPQLIPAHVGMVDTLIARNEITEAQQITAALIQSNPDSALAWYSRGALLARTRETGEAVAALKRAQELAPKQLEVTRQAALLSTLAETLLVAGQVNEARSASDALGKLIPGSPLALLMSSRVMMAANDYVNATQQLRRLVNSAPQFVQARLLLGIALLAQGNVQQAAQELTEVVNQAPQNLEARQLLAQIRMRLDDPDAALRVLVPGLQATPDGSQLSALADSIRLQAGPPETIKVLEEALKETPANEALQVQLAAAYIQAGAAGKAVTVLRKGATVQKDPRRATLLLQAIQQSQGMPAARAEAAAIVDASPNDISIITAVAGFHARSGDFAAGRQLINRALAAKPDQPPLLFTLAQLEWSAKQTDAAAVALRRALQIDAKYDVARLALAELELARNNTAAATDQLEQLRKGGPHAARARLLLARMALSQEDGKRADLLVDEMLKAEPNRNDLRDLAGTMYLEASRFDQAIAQFSAGTAADPTNATLWLNLGRAQMGLGQTGPARESLEKALTHRPHWLPAVGALAFMDLQAGHNDAALRRIADLKQQRAGEPGVAALEGEVSMALLRYKEAAQAFAQAYEQRPSGMLAAKLYQARNAGKLPNAVQPLEQWVQRTPGDLAMRALLAEAYVNAGQRVQAARQYEDILAVQPKHVPSLNNLAWLLHELKDPRALDTARKAHELAPNMAAVSDTLGWILVERGRVDEGLPILKAAAATADSGPEVGYHYAVALARAGSRDAARAELDKLLRDHASFPSRAAAQKLRDELMTG